MKSIIFARIFSRGAMPSETPPRPRPVLLTAKRALRALRIGLRPIRQARGPGPAPACPSGDGRASCERARDEGASERASSLVFLFFAKQKIKKQKFLFAKQIKILRKMNFLRSEA